MADDRARSNRLVEDLAIEGPLERWSRRKKSVAGEDAAPLPAHVPAEVAPSGPSAGDGGPPANPGEPPSKTDADMPPLERLGGDSPLADFFSPGVSEDLRRQALRRVFSQPRFNVTDGLDDYAEDYTRYRPLGDLVTAGLRWHRQRQVELAAEAAERSRLRIDASPDPKPRSPLHETSDGQQVAERVEATEPAERAGEGEST